MYETRDLRLMQDVLSKYEYLVQRPYLNELFCLPICSPPSCYDSIALIQIQSLPKTATFTQFAYILNALAGLGETIGFILTSRCGVRSLYLGIKGKCSTALSLVQNGLQQTFPNSSFCLIEKPEALLDDLFNPKHYPYLASSLVTLNSSYDSIFLQDFVNLVGDQSDYMAFFLAEPIHKPDIQKMCMEFYEIYDVLSYFSQSNYTHYKSESNSSSKANARSLTNTSGQSITNTCGENHAKSHSSYSNISASTPLSYISNRPFASSTSTTQSSTGSGPITTSTTTTTPTLPTQTSSTSTSSRNINATVLINKGKSSSCATNNSEANAHNCSEAKGNTSTHTNTINHTVYQALSFSCPNRRLQEAVAALNSAINRYNTLSRNTAFHFSAYFLSPCNEVSLRAAYSYVGLGQSTYDLSPNVVNCMASDHCDYATIYKFLRSFTTPEFILPDTKRPTRNAIPITSSELLNSLYLPII